MKFNPNPICVTTFPYGLNANILIAKWSLNIQNKIYVMYKTKMPIGKIITKRWEINYIELTDWAERIRFLNDLMQVYNLENVYHRIIMEEIGVLKKE